MKTPGFWRRDGGRLMPALLTPFSWLYRLGLWWRWKVTRPEKAPVPVICVGNLVAGGAGKTPTALALAKVLTAAGRRVHFLSRGYGGRLAGPVRVDLDRHGPRDVGDEPLLLARAAPAWVARDRVAGARAAAAAGAEVILMDDGYQNPSLVKDLSLLVIDAGFGVGNGRLIPAGPLREPVADGVGRADAIVLIGAEGSGKAFGMAHKRPVLWGRLVPRRDSLVLAGRKVVAFAGIGRPEKFFETLAEAGCEVLEGIAFADHHPYRPDEVMALVERAAALGAVAVTTAKDYVRLPEQAKKMVEPFEVELEFSESGAIEALLERFLK